MFVKKKVTGTVAAAVVALALPFVAKWEGLETKAYKDVVGVWTICYGSTANVKEGQVATKKECQDRLARDLVKYYDAISPCMTNKDIPIGVQASLLELAYNVGPAKVCSSTMMRKANSKDYEGACKELGKWVRAGGQTFAGLENRRADSKQNLCLEAIK